MVLPLHPASILDAAGKVAESGCPGDIRSDLVPGDDVETRAVVDLNAIAVPGNEVARGSRCSVPGNEVARGSRCSADCVRDAAVPTSTPLLPLPSATVPVTSVPILFPATTLKLRAAVDLDAIVAVSGNYIALILNRRRRLTG